MKNDELARKVLQKNSDIVMAILFGSLASGLEHFDSDIDLAVGADRPLSSSKKMQMITDLAEAFGRPVDLVDLSTVGEPLLGQIISGGRRIIGSDSCYASLLTKHLFNQADFVPYQSRIFRERRKQWIGL